MANLNAPFGFVAARHQNGGVLRLNSGAQWLIASGSSTAIYAGDVMKGLSTGYVDKAAATDASLIGVFNGVYFVNPFDSRPWWSNYWPAAQATVNSADALAAIADDPDIVFQVQTKTGTNFTFTMVGNNSRLDAGTGSIPNQKSGETLDISNVGTSTDQFRILQLSQIPGNALGDSAIVDVLFNQHLLKSTSGV
jgi:hypothetical protein